MGRSHKIWVDVTGGSGKSFGCGDDDITMDIYVGASATNSQHFSTIKLRQSEYGGKVHFSLEVDGQTYRMEEFDRKTKEFRGITGRIINGSKRSEEKRKKESSESFLRTTATVAMMGSIFCDNKKEANDWKARMLKAGLENKGLIMPEDWDTLSEDEKEKRLNGAIDELSK